MARRTYYFRITFFPRHWSQVVEVCPDYDTEQAKKLIEKWWRSGYLRNDNRNATVHFNALMEVEDIEEFYADTPGLQPKLAPKARRPKWMLVEVEPPAMDASQRAFRRHRRAHPNPSLDLDQYRVDTLRQLVFSTFGVTP